MRYNVTVERTRTISESITVEVVAKSEEDAEEKALDKAEKMADSDAEDYSDYEVTDIESLEDEDANED